MNVVSSAEINFEFESIRVNKFLVRRDQNGRRVFTSGFSVRCASGKESRGKLRVCKSCRTLLKTGPHSIWLASLLPLCSLLRSFSRVRGRGDVVPSCLFLNLA